MLHSDQKVTSFLQSKTTMAQAMSVMMLTQDIDPEKLPVLKLQQSYDDDSREKLELSIIDGRTVKANLYGLNEFFEAAKELTYDTGDELFCHFHKVLRGTIKTDWDSVVNDNGFLNMQNKSPAQFEVCIGAWKLTFVTTDSRQTLIEYCKSLRKPQAMPVKVFVQCLKTLARYVGALPHVDPINAPLLNDEHIKCIVYKAMPTQWQVQFVQTHTGIALTTLLELQNFMSNKKTFTDGIHPTTPRTATVNRT
jgi:hypothetical protein